MGLVARAPVQAPIQERRIHVFTSRVVKPGVFGAKEVREERFVVGLPSERKSVVLGHWGDEKAAEDLKRISAKLSSLGTGVLSTRKRWPRDAFFRFGDVLVVAFEHGLGTHFSAAFSREPMPMSAGEGGALIAGKDFLLASQALPLHALQQLRELFGRVHRIPPIDGAPHIDCFLGVIPSKNILLADPRYARSRGDVISFLTSREQLEPLIIPEEEMHLNPANFLLIENGFEEILLLNHAPRTAELLAKRGVHADILEEPLKRLNGVSEHGLRCVTNEAERGLLEAVLEKARALFGEIARDPRFKRLAGLVSGFVT